MAGKCRSYRQFKCVPGIAHSPFKNSAGVPMKHAHLPLLLLACCIFLLASCDKGNSTDSGNSSTPYARTNGIVINGGVYDNVAVDFNGPGNAKYPTNTLHPPGQI